MMKLLLTSGGIMNSLMEKEIIALTKKPASKLRVAFIPTAANVEDGDKHWLIDDLQSLISMGIGMIDVVDISALPRDIWEKRLRKADVLEFGGGNTFHLMYWIRKSGLDKILEDLLKKKLYIGISAGSIVTNPTLLLSRKEPLDPQFYSEEIGWVQDDTGLNFVDFYIRPHFNNPHFRDITYENIKKRSEGINAPVYLIDDQTAISVNGKKIRVVSKGTYHIFQ